MGNIFSREPLQLYRLIRIFLSFFGNALSESFQSQLYVVLIVNNYMWLLRNYHNAAGCPGFDSTGTIRTKHWT